MHHSSNIENIDKIRLLHKEAKLGHKVWISSKYNDYPDGQDLWGKLSFVVKHCALAGIFGGIVYTRHSPLPKDAVGKLIRIAQVFFPTIATGATFTCVTYNATNLRKKDDMINYILGATAAAAVLCTGMGHPQHSLFFAIPMSALAAGYKGNQLQGVQSSSKFTQNDFSSYIKKNWQYTLLEDSRRGNWTRYP